MHQALVENDNRKRKEGGPRGLGGEKGISQERRRGMNWGGGFLQRQSESVEKKTTRGII